MSQVSIKELSKLSFAESSIVDSKPRNKKILILVPGIRTNADWIDDLSLFPEQFEQIVVMKAYGGRISSWNLLSRIGLRKIRDSIRIQILKIIIQNPGSEISLICHSMGTDIISSLAKDVFQKIQYKFKYIFLMGSICHVKSAENLSSISEYVINHRGVRDGWPIVAATLNSWFYSPTGTFGFGQSTFVNDFKFDSDHFGNTDTKHIIDYILPVIKSGNKDILVPKIDNYRGFDMNKFHYWKMGIQLSAIFSIVAATMSLLFGWLFALGIPVFPVTLLFFLLKYGFMGKETGTPQ